MTYLESSQTFKIEFFAKKEKLTALCCYLFPHKAQS